MCWPFPESCLSVLAYRWGPEVKLAAHGDTFSNCWGLALVLIACVLSLYPLPSSGLPYFIVWWVWEPGLTDLWARPSSIWVCALFQGSKHPKAGSLLRSFLRGVASTSATFNCYRWQTTRSVCKGWKVFVWFPRQKLCAVTYFMTGSFFPAKCPRSPAHSVAGPNRPHCLGTDQVV
jgi:hypothetical protein